MKQPSPLTSPKVTLFGEILFDVFEDGPRLGGAPLNLAVHLHRLGAEVHLISAVGNDALGEVALKEITRQGLDTSQIAKLPHPTGTVTVKLDERKVPTYEFSSDCAYDHIPLPESDELDGDLFCFGTLAQRSAESRKTLQSLLSRKPGRIFCDVNLRQNFYDRTILQKSLEAADLVKLNDEELPIIAALFDLAPESEALAQRFNLETLIVTLGPRGCEVLHHGKKIFSPAWPAKIVSTVGAGDSFSAAFLYTLLAGCDVLEAAEAGNRLAAQVAAQQGAF